MEHSGDTQQIPQFIPTCWGCPTGHLRDIGARDGSLSPTYLTPFLPTVGMEVILRALSSSLSSLPGGIWDPVFPLLLWAQHRAGTPVVLLPHCHHPGGPCHQCPRQDSPSSRPCSWLSVTDGSTWARGHVCPQGPRAGQGTALVWLLQSLPGGFAQPPAPSAAGESKERTEGWALSIPRHLPGRAMSLRWREYSNAGGGPEGTGILTWDLQEGPSPQPGQSCDGNSSTPRQRALGQLTGKFRGEF